MIRAALVAVLLFPTIAPAQVGVPPAVDSVASGGYWQSDNAAGRYRVVVVNSGFEAVASKVFVQWVREPRHPGDEPEVVAEVEPDLPFGQEAASLTASLVAEGKGRVRVNVKGVVSREPSRKVRAVFVATNPGKVTR